MKVNFNCFIFIFVLILGCQKQTVEKLALKPPEGSVVEESVVSIRPAVDILFVVDDSASMKNIQDRISVNADLFIENFFKANFIDYHIGVITSTSSKERANAETPFRDGELVEIEGLRFVSRMTPNSEKILKEMFKVGTDGAGREIFSDMVELALSEELPILENKGFYRKEANLALVYLSDADDASYNLPQDFYKFLLELKDGDAEKIQFMGIITEQADDCQSTYHIENPQFPAEPSPDRIKELFSLFSSGSFLLDICKENYGEDLAGISASIIKRVSSVKLEQIPDLSTIRVLYGDTLIPNESETGWVFNVRDNSIELSSKVEIIISPDKELRVEYRSIFEN